MADAPKPIFREKSLERLSTPDRLDQLQRVVKRRMWVPLLALGGLLVLSLVWCFLGRVPVTADATAILVHPRSVVPIQASASGELISLNLEVGQPVKKDQLIARLQRPELDKEIELQEERLAQFDARATKLHGLNLDSVKREQTLITTQCEMLEARIEKVRERAGLLHERAREYNEKQRERLGTTRDLFEELDAALEKRFESYETLREEKHTSEDTALGAKQRWFANRLGLADIEVKLQELELRELRTTEAYDAQMDLVADLEIRRAQLALRRHEVDQTLLEAEIHSKTDAAEIQRTIDRLRSTRTDQSEIRSDADGRVLEVTVSQGSRVAVGQRIASLAMDEPAEPLRALAYFPIADGKKIRDTMIARVSPVTAQEQRHGSIRAEVIGLSELPVTADSVANQVGNRELARMLVGGESRIEVTLMLRRSPQDATQFLWTSAGGSKPEVSAGTTARVRVILEERAPITLLIPALRGWLGLD